MSDKYYLIEENILVALINTLKNIDVNGYENMSRLVGCVSALEETLQSGAIKNDVEEEE